MTRAKFSRHDLVGEELKKNHSPVKASFFVRMVDRILSDPKKCEFQIMLPVDLYLRADSLVDFISEEFDLEFDLGTLIWILYRDFLGRAYTYNNQVDLYHFISSMDKNKEEVDIYDYRDGQQLITNNNRESVKQRVKVTFPLTKKEALKGEWVLADLFEAFNYHTTLEKLIELHVIHFIQEYKKGNLPNAVSDIVTYCKKILG